MGAASAPAWLVTLGLCATALTAPLAANASDVPVLVNDEENFLYIHAGQTANQLTVALDRTTSEFVISSNLAITPMVNCEAVSPTEARCVRGPEDSLRADLGEGNDHMKLTAPAHAGAVFGGRGNDRVVAGHGRNILGGGDGNDVVKAGSGNDRVFGDPGRDRLYGGGGNDRVRADDGTPDAVIDCGSGDDAVRVDSADPAPRHCERVHVVDMTRAAS